MPRVDIAQKVSSLFETTGDIFHKRLQLGRIEIVQDIRNRQHRIEYGIDLVQSATSGIDTLFACDLDHFGADIDT
ncbi:hypothetical protein D3C81_2004970 [compost metagenome]